MNANELADELDYCYGKEYPCPVSKEAATMLRKLDGQLAFRIDAVTKYQAKVEEQQAEIDNLASIKYVNGVTISKLYAEIEALKVKAHEWYLIAMERHKRNELFRLCNP